MEDDTLCTDAVDQLNSNSKPSGGWVFPVLLLLVLGVAVWIAQRESPNKAKSEAGSLVITAWTPSPQPEGETVGLMVDFGNGASKHFTDLPWQSGMTLEKLMHIATDFRPGIAFSQQGSGELGFLVSLDGLENQGAGGRNWQYRVNGEHGQMSFCLQPLEPGDQVLWGFALEE